MSIQPTPSPSVPVGGTPFAYTPPYAGPSPSFTTEMGASFANNPSEMYNYLLKAKPDMFFVLDKKAGKVYIAKDEATKNIALSAPEHQYQMMKSGTPEGNAGEGAIAPTLLEVTPNFAERMLGVDVAPNAMAAVGGLGTGILSGNPLAGLGGATAGGAIGAGPVNAEVRRMLGYPEQEWSDIGVNAAKGAAQGALQEALPIAGKALGTLGKGIAKGAAELVHPRIPLEDYGVEGKVAGPIARGAQKLIRKAQNIGDVTVPVKTDLMAPTDVNVTKFVHGNPAQSIEEAKTIHEMLQEGADTIDNFTKATSDPFLRKDLGRASASVYERIAREMEPLWQEMSNALETGSSVSPVQTKKFMTLSQKLANRADEISSVASLAKNPNEKEIVNEFTDQFNQIRKQISDISEKVASKDVMRMKAPYMMRSENYNPYTPALQTVGRPASMLVSSRLSQKMSQMGAK